MHVPSLLALLTGTLFAGSALAGHTHKHPKAPQQLEPDAIAQAIEAISQATWDLGYTVVQRPMSIIKAIVTQAQSDGLARKIKKGIKIAQKSEPLNMEIGLRVLVATEELVSIVNQTMTDVIEAHDVFANLPIVPHVPLLPMMDSIVLSDLKRQSKLSKEFGEKVLLKVPAASRQDGQDRLDMIADSFAQAIAVYQNWHTVAEETAVEEDISSNKTAVPFTA